MIKYLDELKKEDLNGKKILLRADFDVPLTQLPTNNHQLIIKIGESFRIKAQKETIDYLVGAGARVLMIAHLGHEVSNASFEPVVEEIGEILGQNVVLVRLKDSLAGNQKLETGNLFLLDNIRQDPREVANDDEFAAELAKGLDFYVDDAFATMHRKHTSVVAITKHLPSYAGFLVKREIENLKQAVDAPAEGKVLVLGGTKISTKMPVIKNFVARAEKILIGGAIANNFFKAGGIKIGSSVADDTPVGIQNNKIILPSDMVVSADKSGKSGGETSKVRDVNPDEAILDIGPETAQNYAEIIGSAKMVIWNGPMGLFEVDKFAEGTNVVAHAVAGARHSVIGGGDTIAAVSKLGLLDKFGFVSTGGGAMLEFLAGNKLPGLVALDFYN